MRRAVITWVVILSVIAGAFGFYLNYFVAGPEDTVAQFVESYNDLDMRSMIDCMDPKFQRSVEAAFGLTEAVSELALGFSMDYSMMMDFMPYMGNMEQLGYPGMEVEILSIVYSGGSVAEALNDLPFEVENLEKLLAEYADVELNIRLGEDRFTETIRLRNYGSDGWKLDSAQLEEEFMKLYENEL